jgi:hypothetical protein
VEKPRLPEIRCNSGFIWFLFDIAGLDVRPVTSSASPKVWRRIFQPTTHTTGMWLDKPFHQA